MTHLSHFGTYIQQQLRDAARTTFVTRKSGAGCILRHSSLAPLKTSQATRPLLRVGFPGTTFTKRKSGAGFTLVETLVYMSLFGLIMGGSVIAAYQMFEASGRNQTHAMMQEEGDFIIGKINWSLSGIQSISTPSAPPLGTSCVSSPTLSVSKWDASIGTIVIDQLGGNLRLSRGGNPAQTLNNTNVSGSGLSFAHCFIGGDNPESVSASFTLTTRTPNGMTLSQDFSTTQYLRK